jgi:hypothetical protein
MHDDFIILMALIPWINQYSVSSPTLIPEININNRFLLLCQGRWRGGYDLLCNEYFVICTCHLLLLGNFDNEGWGGHVAPILRSKHLLWKHLGKWLLESPSSIGVEMLSYLRKGISLSFKTKIPARLYTLQFVKVTATGHRNISGPMMVRYKQRCC